MTRPVAASVDELLAGATSRTPMTAPDAKSGATFERVEIDGRRYVVKHVGWELDWIARAHGDLGPASVRVWSSGLLDRLPAEIDHAYAGAARTERGGALLLHDVGEHLVPADNTRLSEGDHLAFIDALAALHATFWDWTDDAGLIPLANRFLMFSPWMLEVESARGFPTAVPRIAAEGWARLRGISPRMSAVLEPLARDPSPLVAALAETPSTLVHGDVKLGNLGRRPDGRVVLIDWALPGQGVAGMEIAYYVAINRARVPTTFMRERTIAEYRTALERHGVETSPWWECQRALGLLGMMVLLGWEKALGPPEELAWWEARVLEGAEVLAGF
jgi:hypothetical protein